MVYDHMVKINGVYYATGEEVPGIDDMAVEETLPPYFDSDIELETKTEEKQYTKSEINRMSKEKLQELARNMGSEDIDNMTGTELKEYLIGVLGL